MRIPLSNPSTSQWVWNAQSLLPQKSQTLSIRRLCDKINHVLLKRSKSCVISQFKPSTRQKIRTCLIRRNAVSKPVFLHSPLYKTKTTILVSVVRVRIAYVHAPGVVNVFVFFMLNFFGGVWTEAFLPDWTRRVAPAKEPPLPFLFAHGRVTMLDPNQCLSHKKVLNLWCTDIYSE